MSALNAGYQLLRGLQRQRACASRNGLLAKRYCSLCESTSSSAAHANKSLNKSLKSGSTAKQANAKQAKVKSNTDKKASPVQQPRSIPADHRQLAVDQELFTTSIYSPGSPLFLPNGTRIFNKLTEYLRNQYETFGFSEVITPTIYKKSLWEKSGHWENYAEDMFSVSGRGSHNKSKLSEKSGEQTAEDEEFGLKPMNCPGHCLLFASKQRSYKDLPIRYADFSPLHRNEISGALSGLTRVRRFHQDDGHIFCRPSQVFEEISETLNFIKLAYQTFDLGEYRLALSTRPSEGYIGDLADWTTAEDALRQALEESKQPWTINEGDGAFYGPKIDIILKDSDGKEHQAATVQLDFQLPKRFGLEYTAPAPEYEARGEITQDANLNAIQGPVRPVMIHRAVLGSVERFMALLIEHYNGRWPFWLNPRQIMICTLTDRPEHVEYAQRLKKTLAGTHKKQATGIRIVNGIEELYTIEAGVLRRSNIAIDVDTSARHLNKKILDAKTKHYGIIIVIGDRNIRDDLLDVDLSGIPDPKGLLRYEIGSRLAPEEGTAVLPGKKSDNILFAKKDHTGIKNVLAPKELSGFKMQPANLRSLITDMEDSHI